MNYAQKELARATKALKAAARLRKQADALSFENGLSAEVINAAETVSSEALLREHAAEKIVIYWARETVLIADKREREHVAQPAIPSMPAPEDAPTAEELALAATMEPWRAVFLSALGTRGLAAAIQEAGINYNWADYCRRRVRKFAGEWAKAEQQINTDAQ